MLTGMERGMLVTRTRTTTEFRILIIMELQLTTAHWSSTLTSLTLMMTRKEMPVTTAPVVLIPHKGMLMEMGTETLAMMISTRMDTSTLMTTAPMLRTEGRVMRMGMVLGIRGCSQNM